MNQISTNQYGFLLFYTTLYLVTFRDATKLAVQWGAFEFRDRSVFYKKILLYSGPILLILPLLTYFFLSVIVVFVAPKMTFETTYLLKPAFATFLFTLFPWVSLHLWSLIARSKINRGINQGQPGFGWLNTSEGQGILPEGLYSLQVLILFAFAVTGVILESKFSISSIQFPYAYNFWSQSFAAAYISQLVVLFHIAKRRSYFTHKPKLLLSPRMLLTIPHTIIFPAIVGFFFVYPIALTLDKGQFSWWEISKFLLAFPFPYYCNQSTLLIAKYQKWKLEGKGTANDVPSEIREAKWSFWLLCFALETISLAILLLH